MTSFLKKAIAAAAMLGALTVSAQDGLHCVGMSFNIYDQEYTFGLSYHYMFGKYVGIGGSIGFLSDLSSNGILGELYDPSWDWDYGSGWDYPYDDYYYDYDDSQTAFFFSPSIVFESPKLNFGILGVGLTGTAYAMVNTNYYSYCDFLDANDDWASVEYKIDALSYGFTIGPCFSIGPMSLTVGYMYSTLDVDRSYDPRTRRFSNHPIHGAVIELSGRF